MIDDLSPIAILDLAKRGVEKLTENEMLAIAHIVRSRMMWPGLVAWNAHAIRDRTGQDTDVVASDEQRWPLRRDGS